MSACGLWGYQIKSLSQRANPWQPRRAPWSSWGWQGVTLSPWADPHGPNPALVATRVSWGGPCCSNMPWWSQEHPLSLLTSLFCPTIPRLLPHTCSPSKSPCRALAWNCQLILQATNPAASHVVQECKQILVVKLFSLYETQLDRLAFNGTSPELHVWTRHSAEINFL